MLCFYTSICCRELLNFGPRPFFWVSSPRDLLRMFTAEASRHQEATSGTSRSVSCESWSSTTSPSLSDADSQGHLEYEPIRGDDMQENDTTKKQHAGASTRRDAHRHGDRSLASAPLLFPRSILRSGRCPREWRKLISECCALEASRRPTLDEILKTLEAMRGLSDSGRLHDEPLDEEEDGAGNTLSCSVWSVR